MPPIAAHKIAPPALPHAFVPRPRLLTALGHGDEPLTDGVTLVCAPSGFGKSALLAHWARVTAPTSHTSGVAWLDLDGADNDPPRLWHGIVAALTADPAVPPDGPLHQLGRVAAAGPIGPSFPDQVLDALDALPVRIPLVLHDVHELVAPEALRGLEAIVTTRSAGLRIVLCGRLDPPLPLHGLRSEGVLREVRADALRFSLEESGAVLDGLGLHLTRTQATRVHALTRGQPAVLRLVGAVLRADPDVDAVLARFAATSRPVPDFLVGELLAALPAGDREILTAVSIDESSSDELATVLPDRAAARPILHRLTHETGLIAPPTGTGGRYRVAPLLAAHLRAERAHRPQLAADLHRSAARWWAARDDAAAAVGHAAKARDHALLTEVVHRFTGTLLARGGHHLLRDALATLGGATAVDDPWLALCAALTEIESGDAAATRAALARARRRWPADPGHRLTVLRSMTEVLTAAAAADLSAVPTRPDRCRGERQPPEWAALTLASIGATGMLAGGDRSAARTTLQEAVVLARRNGFDYLEMQCLALLAGVAGVSGDYPAMGTAARAVVTLAGDGGWERTPWATAGSWMLAYTALLRAEPAEALRLTEAALERGAGTLQPRLEYALRCVHGAALFDTGRRHRGLRAMQQARADLGAVSLTGEQAAALAVLEHRAALSLNLPDAARTVVGWLTERTGPRAEVALMHAWANQSAGRYSAARDAVGPLVDGSVPAVLPHTVVEALLVQATAGVTSGEVRSARTALSDALSLSEPLDVVRPFATAEPPARALLDRQVDRSPAPSAFTVRALATARHVGAVHGSHLALPEREVLTYLDSPLSVVQIAATLRIPVGQAQARMRAIYRKLGVSSRRTAVAAARMRGLVR